MGQGPPAGGVTGWLGAEDRIGERMWEAHLLRGGCGELGASVGRAMAARREAERRTRHAMEAQRRRQELATAEQRRREAIETEEMTAEDNIEELLRARIARRWREERAGKHTKMQADAGKGT